ncbi:MAG: carbohydrate ABC transporter substrate-binding protein [Anaerolineae bacterium]|nr:carbohydrate ABC transporter substrate-binding protein [Anaerolineae bacterium]
MTKRFLTFVAVLALLALTTIAVSAQDPVEIRFMWYSDGVEGDVMRDLLDRFEADNPGITVTLDVVPYATVRDNLPTLAQAGEAPDMARITNFGGMRGLYLDLRPLMSDPSLLEDNFAGAVLEAFRLPDDTEGLYGFPDSLSVTAPYINRTLFEQAGVDVPSDSMDEVSWAEWTDALKQVAEATGTPYAVAIDNKGHRFAGPAMSMGANFFDADGNFALANDEGFRAFAEIVKGWHDESLIPREVWLGSGGQYTAANEFFESGQVVMYFSGSWQIGRFDSVIGDAFDWAVVPNPTGPGGSTGVAGGAGIVAFAQTEHPAEVAKVMEYMLQPEVYKEYVERSLFIPADKAVIDLGVEYTAENPLVNAALAQFAVEAGKLQDQAIRLNLHPFAFAYYDASNTRLAQYFAGELTLDEAMTRLQEDIDAAVANAGS